MRGRDSGPIAGTQSQPAAADDAARRHVRTSPAGRDEGSVSDGHRRHPQGHAVVVALSQSSARRHPGFAVAFLSRAGQVDCDGESPRRNGTRGRRKGDHPGGGWQASVQRQRYVRAPDHTLQSASGRHGRDRCRELRRVGTDGPPLERAARSEEHTSELQSQSNLVCRLLLEKKKKKKKRIQKQKKKKKKNKKKKKKKKK